MTPRCTRHAGCNAVMRSLNAALAAVPGPEALMARVGIVPGQPVSHEAYGRLWRAIAAQSARNSRISASQTPPSRTSGARHGSGTR